MNVEIGGLTVMVDADDLPIITKYNWKIKRSKTGCKPYVYAYAPEITGSMKSPNTFLHRVVMKAVKGDIVDHIDGNVLNNSKSNLRITDHVSNIRNAKISTRNKSGYKGVFLNSNGAYTANIVVDYQNILLGISHDPKECHELYKDAACYYHKDFANFGDYIPDEEERLARAIRFQKEQLPRITKGLFWNNTSGERCIHQRSSSGNYEVSVQRDRKRVYVGTYYTMESAIVGRDEYIARMSKELQSK